MNSNNWLSFPLSPTHDSTNLNTSHHSHQHFSLGLVNDSIDNPFQHQGWGLMNGQGSNEVPKVADFLGVSKSDVDQSSTTNHHQTADFMAYHEIHHSHQEVSDAAEYLFSGGGGGGVGVNSLMAPLQHTAGGGGVMAAAGSDGYEYSTESASNLQALTLSMGSASGKSETSGDNSTSTNSTAAVDAAAAGAATPRRTLDTFGQRTSIYRGVTRHRWTGRYEAHLWDNSCRREGQSRKGRQVYLGGYDKEEKAARAYDLAALKYWGPSTTTNFPITNYEKEVEDMKHMTRQEFVASIRRKSSGFSRGASMYRGVTRHHQHGRWQARIGRVAGNKDLYLGTFSTEEEAAEAYDIAAIKFRGLNAVTNFDMNRYDVKSILESNTLPIGGGAAKRLKEAQALESSRKRDEMIALGSTYPYATTGSNRLQAYSLMQQQPSPYEQAQPLLTLQNGQDISPYGTAQDATSSFHHNNYLQTQLHLAHQSAAATSYQGGGSSSSQFYNNYLQSNPGMLHGLMNMGSGSTSIMDNNGSGGGGYGGGSGFLGNGLEMGTGGSSNHQVGSGEEGVGALVKVDYDMPPTGGYGGWTGESVPGSNPNVFTMWND
ncbi:AP2-like ethylene-responsive transcription factor PLT2 [Linum grandiflorum]